MSVDVRPMNEAEYNSWRPNSEREYAEDMISSGVDPDAAREKAQRDFPALLPDGLATEGQWLYTVESDGQAAGVVWVAEREQEFGTFLFVYDVRIDESQRGRGLGRAAMRFVEEEARRRGIRQISLNVFGSNDVARGLYRSLGYRETAVWMTKDV